jgi:hypothetical protein
MIDHGPLTKGRITQRFLSEGVMETFFIKNGSFSMQRGLKVRHSTKISTKFVKQVKSYSLPKYTTYTLVKSANIGPVLVTHFSKSVIVT